MEEIIQPIFAHRNLPGEAFTYLGYKPGDLPESEAATREVLALPVFPEMTTDQQNLVADSIPSFYRVRDQSK